MPKQNENNFFDSNVQSEKRKMIKKNEQDEECSSEGTQQLEKCQQIEKDEGQPLLINFLQNSDLQISGKQRQENTKDQKINNSENQKKSIQSQSPIENSFLPRKSVHIVAVSDNHGDYKMMNQILQLKGDIFIHAGTYLSKAILGDFTYQGKDQDFEKFFSFLDKLKFRHKIVISGNHQNVLSKIKLKTLTKISRQKILEELKKRCVYLEHESIEIEGLKIFASPYTPEYCEKSNSRAFQYKPSQDNLIWRDIPKDIDLLITHGPPLGLLDSGKNGKRAGSEALKLAVENIKPKYHIFGHIHESKGEMTKVQKTTYINLCNTPTRFII